MGSTQSDTDTEQKCSPNVSSTGFTKLMDYVMMTASQPELIKTIRKLIKSDPTIINQKNTIGWTALMLACRNSRTCSSERIVRMLIHMGADVTLQDNDGWTALMLASKHSHTDSSDATVRMLIKARANLNLQDNIGWSVLMMISRHVGTNTSESTTRILINARADLNLQNNNGWTALMIASRYSRSDSSEQNVRMLINAGTDLNLQNNNGWTALTLACAFCKTDSTELTVQILIEAGADLNIINHEGKKASDYVMKNKIIDCYIAAIQNKQKIDTIKQMNYAYVLKHIPTHSKIIKYEPGNLGYDITNISFRLKHQPVLDIYTSIDNKLVDYLSVLNPADLVDKISQYSFSQ